MSESSAISGQIFMSAAGATEDSSPRGPEQWRFFFQHIDGFSDVIHHYSMVQVFVFTVGTVKGGEVQFRGGGANTICRARLNLFSPSGVFGNHLPAVGLRSTVSLISLTP